MQHPSRRDLPALRVQPEDLPVVERYQQARVVHDCLLGVGSAVVRGQVGSLDCLDDAEETGPAVDVVVAGTFVSGVVGVSQAGADHCLAHQGLDVGDEEVFVSDVVLEELALEETVEDAKRDGVGL